MEIYWSSLQTARHERELNIFQSGSIKLSQKASHHVTTAGAFSLLLSSYLAKPHGIFRPYSRQRIRSLNRDFCELFFNHRSYNKYPLLTEFEVRIVRYRPSLIRSESRPARSALGP